MPPGRKEEVAATDLPRELSSRRRPTDLSVTSFIAMFIVGALLQAFSVGGPVTSFVSSDGSACFEADGFRLAASALALRQAAPGGAQFNASRAVTDASCASRGFSTGTTQDHCAVGVRVSLVIRLQ